MGLLLPGIIFVALFVGAFLTKRRFGMLVLALCAGLLLSQYLGDYAVDFASIVGFDLSNDSFKDLLISAIALIPVGIVLLSGPRYGGKIPALVSSLIFALFAALIIVKPIAGDLQLSDQMHSYVNIALNSLDVIVPTAIAFALLDVIGTKFSRPHKKSKH